jgi:ATP-dependent DNA helicase Q5
VKDIFTQLHLKEPVKTFKTPCFRTNLYYDVIYEDTLDDSYTHLADFVKDLLSLEDEGIKKVILYKF